MLKKYVHMLLASTVIAGGLTAATVVMGTVTATPAVAAIDLFLGVAPPEPRVEVVPLFLRLLNEEITEAPLLAPGLLRGCTGRCSWTP